MQHKENPLIIGEKFNTKQIVVDIPGARAREGRVLQGCLGEAGFEMGMGRVGIR